MSRPKLRMTTLCSGLIAEQRLRQRAAKRVGQWDKDKRDRLSMWDKRDKLAASARSLRPARGHDGARRRRAIPAFPNVPFGYAHKKSLPRTHIGSSSGTIHLLKVRRERCLRQPRTPRSISIEYTQARHTHETEKPPRKG